MEIKLAFVYTACPAMSAKISESLSYLSTWSWWMWINYCWKWVCEADISSISPFPERGKKDLNSKERVKKYSWIKLHLWTKEFHVVLPSSWTSCLTKTSNNGMFYLSSGPIPHWGTKQNYIMYGLVTAGICRGAICNAEVKLGSIQKGSLCCFWEIS